MPDKNLKKRAFDFAVAAANLISALSYNTVNRQYFNQLARCSSSVGENYRAAQRAKSDKDFINKLKIVEEECDESIYFMELLSALNTNHSNIITPLINEGIEILRIMVASINTTRERLANNKQ
jgi:four helix bundle protein